MSNSRGFLFIVIYSLFSDKQPGWLRQITGQEGISHKISNLDCPDRISHAMAVANETIRCGR